MPHRLSGRTLVIATGHDLSLALLADGQMLAASSVAMARGHAEALVPAIAELLAPFGGPDGRCARVVVETGPGSFTGLRVGLAVGRALAIAWQAELMGVRSTQLVAADARAAGMSGSLLVALEAPRGQIWTEGFAASGLASCLAPSAVSPVEAAQLATQFDQIAGTAPGLLAPGVAPCAPRAAAISALAYHDLGRAELLYVRAADDHQTA